MRARAHAAPRGAFCRPRGERGTPAAAAAQTGPAGAEAPAVKEAAVKEAAVKAEAAERETAAVEREAEAALP